MEDCNGKATGTCQCLNGTSTYGGMRCECCKSGKCKKQCFTRFAIRDMEDTRDTEIKMEEHMCSGQGSCDCDQGGRWDTKQKKGEKCKVNGLH